MLRGKLSSGASTAPKSPVDPVAVVPQLKRQGRGVDPRTFQGIMPMFKALQRK